MCSLRTEKVRRTRLAFELFGRLHRSKVFKKALERLLTLLYFVSSGWWLVENEAKCLAWFPAPYLQRAEMGDDGPDVMEGGSKYRFSGF